MTIFSQVSAALQFKRTAKTILIKKKNRTNLQAVVKRIKQWRTEAEQQFLREEKNLSGEKNIKGGKLYQDMHISSQNKTYKCPHF